MHEIATRPRTVLLPLLNVSAAPDLLALAAALIAGAQAFVPHAAHVLVLAVVAVPADQAPAEGRNMARAYRAMLGYLPAAVTPLGRDAAPETEPVQVPVHALIKVAPTLAQGIRAAVHSEAADLLLLPWKGYSGHPERYVFGQTLDDLVQAPPCNLLLARAGRWSAVRRILLPLRGGPAAELALDTGLSLAGALGVGVTLLHSVATGELRREGDAPYLALQERLAPDLPGPPVEQVFTLAPDVPSLLAEQMWPDDAMILGLPERGLREPLARGRLIDLVLAKPDRPVLLAGTARRLDLAAYAVRRRSQPKLAWSAEQWFVENTYQADEYANPERWLAMRQDRQAHISVVLPTRDDAAQLASLLTGLHRGLQGEPAAPLVDEILVVDADSTDNTPALAAQHGVPVLRARAESGPPGPAAVLREALNLAVGDILVWLDPKAGRLRPAMVAVLVGPLLQDPNVLLVKPCWTSDLPDPDVAEGEGAPSSRFAPVTVQDLLAAPVGELARVPLHGWVRAFYPHLGGLLSPLGRVFAGRTSLLRELLPVLEGAEATMQNAGAAHPGARAMTAFLAGMILETTTRHGSRAIAQVELPSQAHGGPARGPDGADGRPLRLVAELLAFFATRPDLVDQQAAIAQLRARLPGAAP